MRACEFLKEDQTLNPNKLLKDPARFNNLVKNIQSGKPLYLKDGTPIVIDPAEAARIQELQKQGTFAGKVTLLSTDKKQYPLGFFLKTAEYGGQSIPPGQEKTLAPTKEGSKLKPKDIGLHDRDIKAGKLGSEIAANPALNSSDAGKIVIDLCNQITKGEIPTIPAGTDPAVRSAINDYAGEYLGVWALVQGRTDFTNKEKFTEWLNSPLPNLSLFFPSESNNSIADSYALIDPASGHQINISSKGKGGGAPPAISGLKIPDHVREKKPYEFAVQFIELMQNQNLPRPLTISQAFEAMNLIHKYNPSVIPDKFKKFLPWKEDILSLVNTSRKTNAPMLDYQNLWADITFKTEGVSDGGKLTHAVKNAVKEIINSGGIPGFEAAILETLDYNFIQQDTKLRSNGQMYFKTNWPARIDGRVTVETKSGATDPTKGSFSFKLHFK
jgi:hypothetical protein